jgi:hypothetical protein
VERLAVGIDVLFVVTNGIVSLAALGEDVDTFVSSKLCTVEILCWYGYTEVFCPPRNILDDVIMLVANVEYTPVLFMAAVERFLLAVEDITNVEVLYTEEFCLPRNILDDVIMLVAKVENTPVLFMATVERFLLAVEDITNVEVLYTEAFCLPRNILDDGIVLVAKVENTPVLFMATVERFLLAVEDITNVELLYTEEFFLTRNILDDGIVLVDAIMLVEKTEPVFSWFIVDSKEKLWLLVERD